MHLQPRRGTPYSVLGQDSGRRSWFSYAQFIIFFPLLQLARGEHAEAAQTPYSIRLKPELLLDF